MKTKIAITAALLIFSFGARHSISFAQGSLTPSGAPAPTMKSLAQIEPRIDVATLAGDVGSHFVISNPGSYYMSTNLTVTKTNGITIAAVGVTLDLNGFEITRISGSGGNGIRINGSSDRATVYNGTLQGFGYGINGNLSPFAKSCLFEKLAVTGCSTYGIYAGESARVLDCRVHDNSGSGIRTEAGSVISGCTARENQGTYGIYGGTGSTISGCAAFENVGNGSTSYGIYGAGGVIIGCSSYYNSNTNLPATTSQGIGINGSSGTTVKNCSAYGNHSDGIRVSGNCLVEGNNSSFNGNGGDGAGIHSTSTGNRIEANMVTVNDRGINVDSINNLIIRNSASNNGTNYVIAANNSYGTVIDDSGAGGPAVSGSSATSTFGSPNAWANFSY